MSKLMNGHDTSLKIHDVMVKICCIIIPEKDGMYRCRRHRQYRICCLWHVYNRYQEEMKDLKESVVW